MTMTLTGSPSTFVEQIRMKLIKTSFQAQIKGQVEMERALEAGQEAGHERIETAITKTGLERAKNGGHPGRIETEAFWNEFEAGIREVGPSGSSGAVGWEDGGRETYFAYQEQGTQTVEAVHALLDAYEVASADFKKRLTAMVEKEFS